MRLCESVEGISIAILAVDDGTLVVLRDCVEKVATGTAFQ